jgi:hypothetical protein
LQDLLLACASVDASVDASLVFSAEMNDALNECTVDERTPWVTPELQEFLMAVAVQSIH